MRNWKLLWISVMALLAAGFPSHAAHAYMDPGTTGTFFGSIWGMLAPFFALCLVFLGFLIRPVRMFVASAIAKLLGRSTAEPVETDEQPAPGDLPEGDGNGEDTSDDLRS